MYTCVCLCIRDRLQGEIFRDDILCMNQYHHVFNTCRTPYAKRDGIQTYKDGGQHIVVLSNNNVSILQRDFIMSCV